MTTISRTFDFVYYQLENYPLDQALVTKRKGAWKSLSTQDYIDEANRLSRGLLKLGLQKNDKIAVVTSSNCNEWNILDVGILQIGAQNVPIYPTNSVDACHYILQHSEARYVFVSDEDLLDKINQAKENTAVKAIYAFQDIKDCKSWESILKLGSDKSLQEKVDAIKAEIRPEDLATLIYTSGTTGTPKGVMLTHKNITRNVLDSASKVPFDRGSQTALSFLPLCHIFERLIVYLYQYYAVSIHYAESIDTVGNDLKEVKPTFITAVPRVLEKVYAGFQEAGDSMTGIRRILFQWALQLSRQYQPFERQSRFYNWKLHLARKLVLSKWKAGLGGRLEFIVSGSAAISPELAGIYAAAGMLVLEGYGLTETSPVIAVNTNRKEDFKLGTVGKPIDNVEVKIAKDNEILVKGDNVMKGYYKEKEKTEQGFTEDGFFKTGDTGSIDEEGFLKITGRKKQLFKTSGGKYINPQKLETELTQSKFIAHIVVIGEGQKMPAALIQPNFEFIKKWCHHKDIPLKDNSFKTIAENEAVVKRIREEIERFNKKFGHWEQIKDFRLTPGEWSISGKQLTPTLKVKRQEVLKIYKALYDSIYKPF